MSNNDGYEAFVDNEDILGKYSIKDAEEMAKELAMIAPEDLYDSEKQGRLVAKGDKDRPIDPDDELEALLQKR